MTEVCEDSKSLTVIFLSMPFTNLVIRSFDSFEPWPVCFLTLLFLRLVKVSTMKRVRELYVIDQAKSQHSLG